jgi:hypothetical protein
LPTIRLAAASEAAIIFSLTISLASRRAYLPPRISFIVRKAITRFASTANIIKLNIRGPLPIRPHIIKLQVLDEAALGKVSSLHT